MRVQMSRRIIAAALPSARSPEDGLLDLLTARKKRNEITHDERRHRRRHVTGGARSMHFRATARSRSSCGMIFSEIDSPPPFPASSPGVIEARRFEVAAVNREEDGRNVSPLVSSDVSRMSDRIATRCDNGDYSR